MVQLVHQRGQDKPLAVHFQPRDLQDAQLNEAFKALSAQDIAGAERQRHLDQVLGKVDVNSIARVGLSLSQAETPNEKRLGAGLKGYLLDRRRDELDQLSADLRDGFKSQMMAPSGKYQEILSGGIDVKHVESGRKPGEFAYGYSSQEASFKVDPTARDNSSTASRLYEQALETPGEEVRFQHGDTVFHAQASQETKGLVFKKTDTNVSAWVEDNQGGKHYLRSSGRLEEEFRNAAQRAAQERQRSTAQQTTAPAPAPASAGAQEGSIATPRPPQPHTTPTPRTTPPPNPAPAFF